MRLVRCRLCRYMWGINEMCFVHICGVNEIMRCRLCRYMWGINEIRRCRLCRYMWGIEMRLCGVLM